MTEYIHTVVNALINALVNTFRREGGREGEGMSCFLFSYFPAGETYPHAIAWYFLYLK